MALVKYAGGIGQMSGKIAGNVFARNKGGNYVRVGTTPVNPRTPRQSVVRAAMAFLVDLWANTLTVGQRDAWNLYASNVTVLNRLGEAINLSGFNHYIRSNMIRKQNALQRIDNGPTVFEIPAQDPTLAITCSEGTQQITTSFDITMDWAGEASGFLFLFQGSPQNPQINFFNGPWRFIGQVIGADPGPVVSPQINGVAFTIAEGQRQFLYARIARADGRLSEPFRADTFCAP